MPSLVRSNDERPIKRQGRCQQSGRQADVGQRICITTVHRSVQPRAAFTRGDRSNSRPAMYGPRSTTGTVTVFAPCVSVTIVPHGRDLCATPHVSGRNWIGRPFAASHGQHGSRFSKKPGPYHDTVTTLPLAAVGAGVGSGVGAVMRERATGSGSRGSSYAAVTCCSSTVAVTTTGGCGRAPIPETSIGRSSETLKTAIPV